MEKTKLVVVNTTSVYPIGAEHKVELDHIHLHGTKTPKMAWLTPDSAEDFYALRKEVEDRGAKLLISDMYRSAHMQQEAHDKYVAGMAKHNAAPTVYPKPKYSPPPGGSFHQAGRAIDIDISAIGVLATKDKSALAVFWELAAKHGWFPIINKPDSRLSEAWHFDHPGEFAAARRANYRMGAAKAIESIEAPY